MSGSIFVMDKGTTHYKSGPMNFKGMGSSTSSFIFGQVKLIFFAASLLLCHVSVAQGWEMAYGGDGRDEGTAIAEASDGGFLLVGFSESFGADSDLDVYAVRTDIDGKVLWSTVFDEGGMEHAFDVLAEADGTFLIAGDISAGSGAPFNVLLLKLGRRGELLWSRTYETAVREVGRSIARSADGGYLIAGTAEVEGGETKLLLLKVDGDGQLEWRRTYGPEGDVAGQAVVAVDNGYYIAGNADRPGRIDSDIILYRIDLRGRELWAEPLILSTEEADEVYDMIRPAGGGIVIAGRRNFNSDAYLAKFSDVGVLQWESSIGGELGDLANGVTELADGSLVIVGYSEISEVNSDILVAGFDPGGRERWRSTLGAPELAEDGRQIVATRDGNFAIVGWRSEVFSDQLNEMILVKTNDRGEIITNYLSGKVFYDADEACGAYDLTADIPLRGWLLRARGLDTGRVFYGTTDEEGDYRIRVDTGRYRVEVLPVNEYWESCASEGYEVALPEFYDSVSRDFPMIPKTRCPHLEVDVSTPFLEPCTEVIYTVDYRNNGTEGAVGARVEVALDAAMTFVSAGLPVADRSGNVFSFELGDVAVGGQGSFPVVASTETACTAGGIAEGQAALVSAHIFPDTLCTEADPRWDGSSIEVSADCNETSDTVHFLIRNAGSGDMARERAAIVIQDDIILLLESPERSYRLDAGQSLPIPVPAEGGSTYRLIAVQDEYHPTRGFSTAFVEGCVEAGEPFATGFVALFPENDPDPGTSIDVQEISGPAPDVYLKGYPKGYGDERLIDSETDITYTVLFRNSGTDTVRRVVIRDTLPAALDLESVVPGASNFPYSFGIFDDGTLKITFSDIELLPGSDAAPVYGFVKFRVSQKADKPAGTVIDNRASVYYDYLEPLQTNRSRYLSGDFPSYLKTEVVTQIGEVSWPGVEISVYPNPFSETAVIDLKGHDFKEVLFKVFDAAGRLVQESRQEGNKIMYYRGVLPAGLYFFRLESEGNWIGSGKMLIR